MSNDKFLSVTDGIKTLESAISSSSGVADSNKIIKTNGSGLIDLSFLPSNNTGSQITSQAIAGVGRWYNFYPYIITNTTSTNINPNVINLLPFIVERTIKIDGVSLNVNTGASGSTPRIGLYDSVYDNVSDSFTPTNLIIDAGTVNASTAGQKTLNFTPITFNPGIYWTAFLFNIVTNVIIINTGNSPQNMFTLGNTTPSHNSGSGCRTVSQNFDVLPEILTNTDVSSNLAIYSCLRTA